MTDIQLLVFVVPLTVLGIGEAFALWARYAAD
jgi:hypothetical protein